MKDLHYSTIASVIESWEKVRRLKNFEETTGSKVFQRMFTECPEAKLLYGYPLDIDVQDLVNSKRFLMHCSYWIQMIDSSLGLLGPDIELLTEIMTELGRKHVRYGVTPDMYPLMGKCLVSVLQELLGEGVMSPAVVDAWNETFNALSSDMTKGDKA